MAIALPRAFIHDLPIIGLEFTLEPMAELAPTRSGRTIAKNLGPSFWRAQWQSHRMLEDEFGEVRAWHATLLSYEAFYGYDKLREYPLLYKHGWGDLEVGGLAFDGTAALDAVAANTKEIDLSALPAGFGLRPGDYLAFDYGTDSRALHMVVAGGDADGAGELTVEVRPHVRTGWEAAATVDLHRATAKFLILPDTWSAPAEAPHFGRVSFEAIQTL
ncbi:MAG: hypothetical protein WD928_04960 [Gammaproteobacteria bacterium]